jgi:hypothetical protein
VFRINVEKASLRSLNIAELPARLPGLRDVWVGPGARVGFAQDALLFDTMDNAVAARTQLVREGHSVSQPGPDTLEVR